MREPKTKDALPRWLRQQSDYLENLLRYGQPDHTPGNRQFFQDVEVRETMADVKRVCARFGIEVPGDMTDPQAALIQVGRVLAGLRQQSEGMVDIDRAAVLLGLSVSGVRKLVDRSRRGGRGPMIRFHQSRKGGPILFRLEWVNDYLDSPNPQSRPNSHGSNWGSR